MSNNKEGGNHIPDVGKKVSSIDWLVNFFENGVTSREECITYARNFANQMLQNKRFVTA